MPSVCRKFGRKSAGCLQRALGGKRAERFAVVSKHGRPFSAARKAVDRPSAEHADAEPVGLKADASGRIEGGDIDG